MQRACRPYLGARAERSTITDLASSQGYLESEKGRWGCMPSVTRTTVCYVPSLHVLALCSPLSRSRYSDPLFMRCGVTAAARITAVRTVHTARWLRRRRRVPSRPAIGSIRACRFNACCTPPSQPLTASSVTTISSCQVARCAIARGAHVCFSLTPNAPLHS